MGWVFCSRSLATNLIHQPDELVGVYKLGLGLFEVYTQGRVALSPGVDLFKPVGLRTMNVYDTLIYHIGADKITYNIGISVVVDFDLFDFVDCPVDCR